MVCLCLQVFTFYSYILGPQVLTFFCFNLCQRSSLSPSSASFLVGSCWVRSLGIRFSRWNCKALISWGNPSKLDLRRWVNYSQFIISCQRTAQFAVSPVIDEHSLPLLLTKLKGGIDFANNVSTAKNQSCFVCVFFLISLIWCFRWFPLRIMVQ